MIGNCRLGPIRFRVTKQVQGLHRRLFDPLSVRGGVPVLAHGPHLMFVAQDVRCERATGLLSHATDRHRGRPASQVV
jgi:hypothetical protein